MFKLVRNLFVFGFLYAGYKWLRERFGKTSETAVPKKQGAETRSEAT